MRGKLLVATGLAREARLAAGEHVAAVCSGGDVALLARRLDARNAAEIRGVVSFGLAGGLDPALRPGDLAIAAAIVTPTARFDVDPGLTGALRDELEGAGLPHAEGAFAGADAPALTPADKAALRRTGAVVVDMESHAAARWAAARGLPFAALRAVSDPAHRALPPLAAGALDAQGEVAIGRVLIGLAKSPGQIGALIAAGRDSRAAFATLARAGRLLALI